MHLYGDGRELATAPGSLPLDQTETILDAFAALDN